MKKLMVGAVVAAVACGCVSVNKNDGGYSITDNAVAKDIIHEKLAVQQTQVSGADKIHCLFGFITWGSSASHRADVCEASSPTMSDVAKNGAYANACDAGNCDQLVATRYKVTTKDYFVYAQCQAEVKGFPANVVGVETIENKDPNVKKGCKSAVPFGIPGIPFPKELAEM